MLGRGLLALTCAAGLLAAAAPARAVAQDAVAQARAQVAEADFEGAVATLRTALSGTGMTRAQVGDALATIAAASFALGRGEDVRAALAQLAVIDAHYTFGEDVPPEIQEAFVAERRDARPVRARLDVTASATGHEVAATADVTAPGLVREVRLTCDGEHGPGLAAGATPSLLVVGDAHCVAEAHGLGGLVLASAQTDVGTPRVGDGGPQVAHHDAEVPWLWIGVGAAAVAVIAIVVIVAVAASSGPDQTRFTPVVTF